MRRLDIMKKKKYMVGGTAAVAVAVTSCAIGSVPGRQISLSGHEYLAGTEENVATDTDAIITDADDLAEKLSDSVDISAKEVDKDETVYAFADATGKVDTILVNETLKNRNGEKELSDETELKDIVNVKGEETFSQNGTTVTWQADGNEISYQGTTDKKLPVNVKVTYYLEGKEIAPAELAGKTGHVKIRFDYSSEETVRKEVNGKTEDITVPFVAVTGMILNDNFTNVSVENGKYLTQGDSNIVIGYAMPGWEDSMGDVLADSELTIPNYVEVSADVVDFAVDMSVTMVLNGSEVNMNGGIDLTDMDEIAESLQSAGNQLANGSDELANGANTLAEKMTELSDGAGSLKDGVNTLYNKTGALSSGVDTLNASAQAISDGINTLDNSLKAPMTVEQKQAVANQASAQAVAAVESNFAEGSATYNQIYAQAAASYESAILGATDQITQSYLQSAAYATFYDNSLWAAAAKTYSVDPSFSVQDYYNMYKNGSLLTPNGYTVAQEVQAAFSTMASSTTSALAAGGKDASAAAVVAACKQSASTTASQVAAQTAVSSAETTKATIASQIEAVQSNGYSLVTGADALAKGTGTLAEAVPALTDGINQLLNGANTLSNGAGLLSDGANQVATGADTLSQSLNTLNGEAIQKMVQTYNGDVKVFVDRAKASVEAATEYDTFAGRGENVSSTTKFIIKTAGVSLD